MDDLVCAENANQTNVGAHRRGMTDREVYKYYSDWADRGTYDIDLGPSNYQGPQICAQFLSNYLTDKEAGILDVAAGTGRLGAELQRLGYINVDGLEPAEGMLEAAKRKMLYRRHILLPFTCNTQDLKSDAYDALVVSGGMGEGHIKCDALQEMTRCVKKCGYVVIVMRQAYLQEVKEYRGRLEPCMAALEKDRKWKMVERTVVPKYSFENDGVVFVFQVTQNNGC